MIDRGRPHLLVVGVTVRALAVSAARAGYRVTAVDAFGDLDLCRIADAVSLRSEDHTQYSPERAVAAAERVRADLVAYTSNFENYPDAVARLARHRELLGNPPEVLVQVRNPIELMRRLRRRGFATPETRATAVVNPTKVDPWLLKPRRSGGGHGTVPWRAGSPVSRRNYLQQRIAGTPGSIIFAADGRHIVPLGITLQLVGDARFGTHGFRYCGSLLSTGSAKLFARQEELTEQAVSLALATTREFGLRGLNGIDFVAKGGVPYPIEVNPRYSASMELAERAQGLSVFEVHARACRGVLPRVPSARTRVYGKAILFARRDFVASDICRWDEDAPFADIPHPGELIRRGHPICTVFAEASDAATCYRRLVKRAAALYRDVEWVKRGAA